MKSKSPWRLEQVSPSVLHLTIILPGQASFVLKDKYELNLLVPYSYIHWDTYWIQNSRFLRATILKTNQLSFKYRRKSISRRTSDLFFPATEPPVNSTSAVLKYSILCFVLAVEVHLLSQFFTYSVLLEHFILKAIILSLYVIIHLCTLTLC